MKTTLYDLYRGPLAVWVEDRLTHAVLTELWSDPQINLLVAEGKPGVLHMVGARPAGRHVYGVVDRDFDSGNEAQWLAHDCRILRLPVHELENLLLDFDVLASLSGVEPAPRIRERAHGCARRMLFWMSGCSVLWDMQRDLGKGFPARLRDPLGLQSLADVSRYLDESAYWTGHDAAWQRWNRRPAREQALEAAQEVLKAQLDGDDWIQSFSGKEMFRFLRSRVPGLDRTPKRPPQPTPSDLDLNLAKEIARRMKELGQVPAALARLREVLRAKAGLGP